MSHREVTAHCFPAEQIDTESGKLEFQPCSLFFQPCLCPPAWLIPLCKWASLNGDQAGHVALWERLLQLLAFITEPRCGRHALDLHFTMTISLHTPVIMRWPCLTGHFQPLYQCHSHIRTWSQTRWFYNEIPCKDFLFMESNRYSQASAASAPSPCTPSMPSPCLIKKRLSCLFLRRKD